jgi:3-hydroxyisobutyrate dehydrogenase-like beta-hydroxyacid dehydrogenase
MNQQKPTIGFIGLGLMGSRMAARLLEAGYPLIVYNRTREKTQALAARGANVANTPREPTAAADVVMLSVSNDEAVAEAMRGPEGVIAGLQSGKTVIDLSTVSPRISRMLAAEVKTRGAAMLDAPVSGSTPQVEQGTLIIMVGGDEDVYRRSQPILQVLGKQIFHLGPNGMGLVMKLVANSLLGLGLQALAEAIALGEGAGLETARLLEVLGQLVVVSPSQKSKLENARKESYPPAFPLQHMDKDFGLISELANQSDVPMPSTSAAHQMSKAAHAQGLEGDFSVVIHLMRQLAGVATR